MVVQWRVFGAVVLVGLAACASNAPADAAGSSAAAATQGSSGSCGNYEAKNCDPQRIIDYVHSQDADDTFNTVIGCTECGAALLAAGAVAAWTVESPPLLIGAGELITLVKTSSDCEQCLKFSEQSGILEVLSCALEPCKYSEAGNQADCEQSAPDGMLGFKNRGTYTCSYTKNPLEAECRLTCDETTHIQKDPDGRCWCPPNQ
jgi:hypothetical protein